MRTWGMTPLFVLFAFFSLIFGLGKSAILHGNVFLFILFRTLGSSLLLMLIFFLFGKGSLSKIKRDRWLFFQVGLFNVFLTFFFFFENICYVPVAFSAFLFVLAPFFSFLIAYCLGDEEMTVKKITGMCIGVCGFIPVLMTTYQSNISLGMAIPIFSILISVVSNAYGWIIVRRLVLKGHGSILINVVAMTIGCALIIAVGLCRGIFVESFYQKGCWSSFLWYTGLTVLIGTFCYLLYTALLKYYTATFVAFVGLVQPLFAGIYGSLFLNEKMSWVFIPSLCILWLGLHIFYQEERYTLS